MELLMIQMGSGNDFEFDRIIDRMVEDIVVQRAEKPVDIHAESPKCCTTGVGGIKEVSSLDELVASLRLCRTAFLLVYSTYCPMCHAFAPVYERISEEFNGRALFLAANADYAPEIAYELGIMGTPTTVVFVDGKPVDAVVGYVPYRQFRGVVSGILRRVGCLEKLGGGRDVYTM